MLAPTTPARPGPALTRRLRAVALRTATATTGMPAPPTAAAWASARPIRSPGAARSTRTATTATPAPRTPAQADGARPTRSPDAVRRTRTARTATHAPKLGAKGDSAGPRPRQVAALWTASATTSTRAPWTGASTPAVSLPRFQAAGTEAMAAQTAAWTTAARAQTGAFDGTGASSPPTWARVSTRDRIGGRASTAARAGPTPVHPRTAASGWAARGSSSTTTAANAATPVPRLATAPRRSSGGCWRGFCCGGAFFASTEPSGGSTDARGRGSRTESGQRSASREFRSNRLRPAGPLRRRAAPRSGPRPSAPSRASDPASRRGASSG